MALTPTSMPEDLTLTDEVLGDIAVIHVAGDVDQISCEPISARVTARLEQGVSTVLDLTAVRFLGSAGLSLLVAAHTTARLFGAGFVIVADKPVVLRPIELTGLAPILPITSTLTTALSRVTELT
ncbi:STAS domain-containing protein [Amycolatopsis azurea]|uniref:STAS domain-containing protein n=1 Tax=Amycolatopsis azurea TaxID=36819 RepID=UPI0037FDB310